MSAEQNKNYFFCSAKVAYGDRGEGRKLAGHCFVISRSKIFQ